MSTIPWFPAKRFGLAALIAMLMGCSPEAPPDAGASLAPASAPSIPADRPITDDAEYQALYAKLGGEDGFHSKLVAFLGPLRGYYVLPGNELVYDQVGEALSGAPVRIEALGKGGYLVWNCRPHSCDERGAVIFSPTGSIVAVGMIHFSCGRDCYGPGRLTIFRRSPIDPSRMDPLERWAERQRPDYKEQREAFAPTETVILE